MSEKLLKMFRNLWLGEFHDKEEGKLQDLVLNLKNVLLVNISLLFSSYSNTPKD